MTFFPQVIGHHEVGESPKLSDSAFAVSTITSLAKIKSVGALIHNSRNYRCYSKSEEIEEDKFGT